MWMKWYSRIQYVCVHYYIDNKLRNVFSPVTICGRKYTVLRCIRAWAVLLPTERPHFCVNRLGPTSGRLRGLTQKSLYLAGQRFSPLHVWQPHGTKTAGKAAFHTSDAHIWSAANCFLSSKSVHSQRTHCISAGSVFRGSLERHRPPGIRRLSQFSMTVVTF